VDEVKAALSGMLAPEKKEVVHRPGRDSPGVPHFRVGAGRRLHGARRPGQAQRLGAPAAQQHVVHTGELDSLKRFKDDVREVKAGFECGLSLKNFNDIKEGDQLEVFEVRKSPARL
jgi:translation initiation factor IF-2